MAITSTRRCRHGTDVKCRGGRPTSGSSSVRASVLLGAKIASTGKVGGIGHPVVAVIDVELVMAVDRDIARPARSEERGLQSPGALDLVAPTSQADRKRLLTDHRTPAGDAARLHKKLATSRMHRGDQHAVQSVCQGPEARGWEPTQRPCVRQLDRTTLSCTATASRLLQFEPQRLQNNWTVKIQNCFARALRRLASASAVFGRMCRRYPCMGNRAETARIGRLQPLFGAVLDVQKGAPSCRSSDPIKPRQHSRAASSPSARSSPRRHQRWSRSRPSPSSTS